LPAGGLIPGHADIRKRHIISIWPHLRSKRAQKTPTPGRGDWIRLTDSVVSRADRSVNA
jgi:hypothetical protein